MKITQFNGYHPQCLEKNSSPAFGMKLITSENALAFYEKRLGSKIKVCDALDKFSKALEEATPDVKLVAKLDIDEQSMGKPELFVQENNGVLLRASKYPAWVFPDEILPAANDKKPLQSAVKHAVNCMHRIMNENGHGFGKDNAFTDAFSKAIS